MTRRQRHTLQAIALISAIACSDSTTGPTESPDGQIVVGQTVLARFDSIEPAIALTFQAIADSAYAVEIIPREGGASVDVVDSVTGAYVYSSSVTVIPSTPAPQRITPVFIARTTGPFRILLYSYTYPASGRVEVTLRTSGSRPETIPATIVIGNSVTGEGLGTPLDIDEFTFTGIAGALIVPELHLPGTPDPTRLACLRIFSSSDSVISTTIASPGDTLPGIWSHSRAALPATGTYKVRVGNGWNGCSPRAPLFYNGPFSFTIVPIDPAPEVAPATVALGDTVTSESIGRVGDLDRFTIQGTPGALLEVLPRRPPGGSGGIKFIVGGATTRVLGPTDTSWGSGTAGRIALPDSGKLTLTITGVLDGPKGDTGAYSFIAFPIDTAPEGRPSAFALGDTIDEALDPSGDIDHYTFTGIAGEQVAFDFRIDQVPYGEPVIIEALRPDGTPLTTFEHGGGYDTTETTTGRLQLPTSGQYVLRARTYFNGQGPKRRTYHLRSQLIDAAPESAPDTLALGDSVTTESLDGRWDVDTFRVRVTESGLLTKLSLSADAAAAGNGGAYARLVDSATGTTLAEVTAGPGTTSSSLLLSLVPGSYLLRVSDGGSRNDQLTGPYRVRLARVQVAPEVAPDTIQLGDTVTAEAIDGPDDIDQFFLPLTKGQSVLVSLTGTGAPGGTVSVSFDPGAGAYPVTVRSPTAGGPLGSYTSARIDVTTTGIHHLEVRGDLGPYTLAIVALPTTPESAADSFAVGDSVTGEAIGTPGDLDRYTVTAPPGALAVLRFTAALANGSVNLVVRDPVGDSTLVVLPNPGDTARSDRFRFPAGGKLEMTVAEPAPFGWRDCTTADCNGFYQTTGTYSFAVIPIDSAPESVPATLVRGDTVTGEAIAPIGDLDVFTYAGTAGESFQFEIQTGPGVANSVIYSIQLVDMSDGAVLTEFGMFADGDYTTGATLPHTGTYELRISGYEQFKSFGQYSLVIK